MFETEANVIDKRENSYCKAFISYSHDSEAHRSRMLDLADRLNLEGVDCEIDQYQETGPEEGWVKWMIRQIEESTFILVVCTETYHTRSQSKNGSSGKGTKFESLLSFQELYDFAGENRKYVPVLINKSDSKHIPLPLKPYQYHHIEDEEGYENLYRFLTDQPRVTKPVTGRQKTLPVKQDRRYAQADGHQASATEEPAPAVDGNTENGCIEITLDKDFDSYGEREQAYLLNGISELLKVKGSDLIIKNIRKGSVIVELEARRELVDKILELYQAGELTHLDVTNAVTKDAGNVHASELKAQSSTETLKSRFTSSLSGSGAQQEGARLHQGGARQLGTVKWFNNARGYGFITGDDGDVFVHYRSIVGEGYRSLKEGDKVEFSLKDDKDGGLTADDVCSI